jgi:hypothetical protein
VFYATFSNISAIIWRPVLVVEEAGEPPTIGKQLINFITCGCESALDRICSTGNQQKHVHIPKLSGSKLLIISAYIY